MRGLRPPNGSRFVKLNSACANHGECVRVDNQICVPPAGGAPMMEDIHDGET